MESTNPTPTASSTVTSSSSSTLSYQGSGFRLLEISLISAQDLFPVSKSMRTYAVTWVHPNRKLNTRVDQQGHTNPTWNDKFAFRVDDEFLLSEKAAVNVEIYTVSWFRGVIVGTVRVLISSLITPQQYQSGNRRYVALQIRRPSGSPQGILNMGVSLVDSTMRSMPLCTEICAKPLDDREILEKEKKENKQELNPKIQLWRSLSVGTDVNSEDFPVKPGSVCNGSNVNGGSTVNDSELCSDVGPSASIVAAEIAQKSTPQVTTQPSKVLRPDTEAEESESCILEEFTAEEAAAKGLTRNVTRWKKEVQSKREEDSENPQPSKALARRRSEAGLFSCFGNAYGFEFTIVCGASNNSPKPPDIRSKKKTSSKANSA